MSDWHVKKEITWSHIVTTAMLVVSAVMAWGNLNSEIALVKQEQEFQKQQIKDNKEQIEEQLEKIDQNVQKIIDHLLKEKELQNGNRWRDSK